MIKENSDNYSLMVEGQPIEEYNNKLEEELKRIQSYEETSQNSVSNKENEQERDIQEQTEENLRPLPEFYNNYEHDKSIPVFSKRTLSDTGKAVWNEAGKLFVSKENEFDYRPVTETGDFVKGFYREAAGFIPAVIATFFTGGVTAFLAGGVSLANKGTKIASIAKGIYKFSKFVQKGTVFNPAKGIGKKLGKIGTRITNGVIGGQIPSTLKDWFLYKKGEGTLFDSILPNNELTSFLKTDENSPEWQNKLRYIASNSLLGAGLGVVGEFTINPVLEVLTRKSLKNLHKLINSKTEKEVEENLSKVVAGEIENKKTVNNLGTEQNTLQRMKEAQEKGVDFETYMKNEHPDEETELKMYSILKNGDEIFYYDDGSWSIKVSKWEDAAKVTPEQYKAQLKRVDEDLFETRLQEERARLGRDLTKEEIEALGVKEGTTAIQHMNEAVKDTWKQRNLLDSNIDNPLFDNKGKPVSKKVTGIVNNFKDKHDIKNKIKVQFLNGLEGGIQGKTVSAKTTGTKINEAKKIKIQETRNKIQELENSLNIKKEDTHLQNSIDTLKQQIEELKQKIQGDKTKGEKNLKEKLRIAENKLKNLEKKKTNSPKDIEAVKNKIEIEKKKLTELEKTEKRENIAKDITINIDINSENPYAVLRSELEHARDIAKGTVPKDKKQHFSRYQGANEAEIAPSFVKHKADRKKEILTGEKPNGIDYNSNISVEENLKQKKELENYKVKSNRDSDFGENPDINDLDYEPYTIHSIENTKGDKLGHIRVKNGDYIDWSSNNNVEKGAVRKLIAKLLYENKYQSLKWEATSESSVKSYNHFCEEFPDLVDKIEFKDSWTNTFDIDLNLNYTQKKGVLNEGSQGSNKIGGRKEILRTDNSSDNQQALSTVSENEGRNRVNKSGIYTESNSAVNERGSITNNNNEFGLRPDKGRTVEEPEQLKLDFTAKTENKTAEEVINDLSQGRTKFKTEADVHNLVEKTIFELPESKSWDWKTLLKSGDDIADYFQEQFSRGNDVSELQKAFDLGDEAYLNKYVQLQLAAQRIVRNLQDKVKAMPKDTEPVKAASLIDVISQLNDYTKELGSAAGAILNSQKLVNKAVDTFRNKRTSYLEEQGIKRLSDIITKKIQEIIELNFTEGKNLADKDLLKDIYREFFSMKETRDLFQKDKTFKEAVNKIVSEGVKAKGNKAVIQNALEKEFINYKYKTAFDAVRKSPDTSSLLDNLPFAKMESYYKVNLLSSPVTALKNTISGAINTMTVPLEKIWAGLTDIGVLGVGMIDKTEREALIDEGVYGMLSTLNELKECLRYGWNTFITGETESIFQINQDLMNSVGDIKGSRLINLNNFKFKDTYGVISSLIPRVMAGTDITFRQLNYRRILRGKSYALVKSYASKNMTREDIAKEAEKYFKQGFTKEGKPTDMETWFEAQEALYQAPLSNRINDVQYREDSFITSAGNNINKAIAQHPLLGTVFSFMTTGTNIIQSIYEHSGANYLPAAFRKLFDKNADPVLFRNTREGAIARARAGSGLLITGLATMMVGTGALQVTGSMPLDKKERRALLKTGWKPYSIKINGEYISYQGYEPIQTILGFAADCSSIFMKHKNNIPQEMFMEILTSLINNFVDKASYRQGMSILNALMNPDEETSSLSKGISQYLSGYLPLSSGVKFSSSFGERYDTNPQGYERIINKYFNKGLGDYRRNYFGEKQKVEQAFLTTNSKVEDLPEDIEMRALAERGWTPSQTKEVLDNVEGHFNLSDFVNKNTKRSLTDCVDEEMSTITIGGKTLREKIRELVESDSYKQLIYDGISKKDPDTGEKEIQAYDTKTDRIKDVYILYRERAKAKVLSDKVNKEQFVSKSGVLLGEAVNYYWTSRREAQKNRLNEQLRHF